MIKLTGYIDVPADRVEAVSKALPRHVALTRAEPGCLSFDVTPDVSVPGRFQVAELFTDQKAFDAHQTRTKSSEWATVTADIPRTYQIEDLTE
ncbi:MAG: antibiotic biosynthesis monooxygenase [Shimia sp.]|uniref:putative quinol monooxygenase n=1 Tax=Shimia sp. TaxID=1954381 RepID=UPI001B10293F|nr:putative quinol monooxygenase [Shimia sp.]MBO6896337.1 antibiotic biosynthesis monooxygenase [Shimia sp.]